MKQTLAFRLIFLVLTISMVFSLFAGCGDTSTPVSSAKTVTQGEDDLDDYVYGESNTASASGGEDVSGGKDGTGSKGIGDNKTNSGKTQNNSSKSENKNNNDLFENIPKELKGTTVTIAHWGDEGASEYVKVAKQFSKETRINVKWVTYSADEYVSSVVKQISAKTGPDIVILNNSFPAALEMVQPLPAIFNVNDGFWDKRVTEALAVNGKNYFVNSYNSPFTGGTVVYYNKKIFSDNGLTSPQDYLNQGKWTYENLEKCMQQVKKVGFHGGIIESIIIAEQMGSSLIEYDKSKGTFRANPKDDNLVSAIQYMARGVEQGITGGYGISNFSSGQVGICMAGTYGLKYNGYFKDMAPSEIGVVPLPTSFGGKKLEYSPLGLRGYGIAKGAKNSEGAYYFLRYFLDLDKYQKAGANIFANKVMEKYFVETQLPNFKKAKLYFEYYSAPLSMVGKPWSGADWTAVRRASVGQVAVELDKMANVCTNAAKVANEKLNTLK